MIRALITRRPDSRRRSNLENGSPSRHQRRRRRYVLTQRSPALPIDGRNSEAVQLKFPAAGQNIGAIILRFDLYFVTPCRDSFFVQCMRPKGVYWEVASRLLLGFMDIDQLRNHQDASEFLCLTFWISLGKHLAAQECSAARPLDGGFHWSRNVFLSAARAHPSNSSEHWLNGSIGKSASPRRQPSIRS